MLCMKATNHVPVEPIIHSSHSFAHHYPFWCHIIVLFPPSKIKKTTAPTPSKSWAMVNLYTPVYYVFPNDLQLCLRTKLRIVQATVDASRSKQLLMTSLFRDALLGHDHDAVCVFDRRQPMSND